MTLALELTPRAEAIATATYGIAMLAIAALIIILARRRK